MRNTTNTLVSSTIVKTPAMNDFTNVQTLAMVAYAFEQTNVYVCVLYAQFTQFVYVLYENVCLLYAQFEDIVSEAIVMGAMDFEAIVLYAQYLFYAQPKAT